MLGDDDYRMLGMNLSILIRNAMCKKYHWPVSRHRPLPPHDVPVILKNIVAWPLHRGEAMEIFSRRYRPKRGDGVRALVSLSKIGGRARQRGRDPKRASRTSSTTKKERALRKRSKSIRNNPP